MKRILVTGMSGTGKSTVLAELARRGHRVVDTDYDGWAEDVLLPDGSGLERLWREDLMSALLVQHSDGLRPFAHAIVAEIGSARSESTSL